MLSKSFRRMCQSVHGPAMSAKVIIIRHSGAKVDEIHLVPKLWISVQQNTHKYFPPFVFHGSILIASMLDAIILESFDIIVATRTNDQRDVFPRMTRRVCRILCGRERNKKRRHLISAILSMLRHVAVVIPTGVYPVIALRQIECAIGIVNSNEHGHERNVGRYVRMFHRVDLPSDESSPVTFRHELSQGGGRSDTAHDGLCQYFPPVNDDATRPVPVVDQYGIDGGSHEHLSTTFFDQSYDTF
mmetsp:Transcript_10308/g.18524  ORF Transcript_10308/g.18524 Transcript_10308/m.18524 type:complete len:244 (-) Transcript_10308:369-1100(-)